MPKRLAVFRALQLGDMLCAVPALRALRRSLPETSITLVGLPWAKQFAERFCTYIDEFVAFPGHPALPEQPPPGLPAISRSFEADMRARHFDLALQLHGDGSSTNGIVARWQARLGAGFVPAGDAGSRTFLPYSGTGNEIERLLALVSHLGARHVEAALEFPVLARDRAELEQLGVGNGLPAGSYVCLHPGARAENKRWPQANFAAVGDALHREYGLPIVITGSAEEAALADGIAKRMSAPCTNAAGPCSVGGLAALLAGARLLVSNDTGVSHLAAALRLPSVVIFSASDMDRWAPMNRHRHRCVWDPEGRRVEAVIAEARSLLADARA